MKIFTSSGLMPLFAGFLTLFSLLSAAWPQAHHRHGILHRDHKKDGSGKDVSPMASGSSVSTTLASFISTSTATFIGVAIATPLASSNTGLLSSTGISDSCDTSSSTLAPAPSSSVPFELRKRQVTRSTSTTVVYVTNTETVTVDADAINPGAELSSTSSSTLTPSGSSNLAPSGGSTSSVLSSSSGTNPSLPTSSSTATSVNPFDGSYASFVLGPVGSSSSSTGSTASSSSVANPFAGSYQSFLFSRKSTTTPTSSLASSTTSSTAAPTTSVAACPAANGTTYTSTSGEPYLVLCDLDFNHDDILPFLLVTSFADCVRQCDNYNIQNPQGPYCLAAVFAPSRATYTDDCYLKHSNGTISVSDITLYGAVLQSNLTSVTLTSTPTPSSAVVAPSSFFPVVSTTINPLTVDFIASVSASSSSQALQSSSAAIASSSSSPQAASSSPSSSAQTTSQPPGIVSDVTAPSSSFLTSSSSLLGLSSSQSSAPSYSSPSPSVSQVSAQPIVYAPGAAMIAPQLGTSVYHGPMVNTPTTEYIKWPAFSDPPLPSNLYTIGVNPNLTTNYPMAPDTGNLQLNATTEPLLTPMSSSVHLSRDGGKGGYLNGQHLFIFCDTGSYTQPSSVAMGTFLGFISSSVATDTGMNGLNGSALNIQDGTGEWSDDVGRMRGFSPMTQGEQSYNLKMQGLGQRYAVWPESSIIPLDATSAIMIAPIVYDNVDMTTQAAVFTYVGSTLLTITAGGKGGPVAERTVARLFNDNEVQWGGIGGIRSWGISGVGGSDGRVYLFGDTSNGMLLARTTPGFVGQRDSYEYWSNGAWVDSMPPSTATDYFLSGNYMDVDLFYSPRHLTFIIVYMTGYADNTFYYRYLNATTAILPPYAGGDPSVDFVENIVKYQWSQEHLLYKAPAPLNGKYTYAGGVHQGYFGADDITNGGSKMLLSWTSPTGENPATLDSEYQIVTAEVGLL